jgi:hypothetical protein
MSGIVGIINFDGAPVNRELLQEMTDYIWSWHTRISDGEQLKADFKQSTFYGTPLSAKQLQKRASGYVPRLTEQGQVDQLILELMSRSISLGEIGEQILSQFPRRFSDVREALSYVGELSQKYSV